MVTDLVRACNAIRLEFQGSLITSGEQPLSIDSSTAVARAKVSIEEITTALSLSNCERLHAGVVGYCRALLDCGVIDDVQWKELTNLVNSALADWRPELHVFTH